MLERFLLLNTIDSRWKDHLRAMDALKQGIGLRGYAQVDPKVEYKREGYDKFQMLLAAIAEEVTGLFFRLEVRQENRETLDRRLDANQAGRQTIGPVGPSPTGVVPAAMAAMQRGRERAANQAGAQGPVKPITRTADRVGRNDPCPCGSGKKYKRCCYPKYDK